MCNIIYLFIFSISASITGVFSAPEVYRMHQGEEIRVPSFFKNQLTVFCYNGVPKNVIHLWQSVFIHINHPTNDYSVYNGLTPEAVKKEYDGNRIGWSLNIFSKENNFKVDPFNSTCVGIVTNEPYSVFLNVIRIDLWKILYLVLGIVLFFSADRLSCNTIFYYICGVTFGICASFLILIYFASKLFPRKPFMYGILGCGWTVVIYILQMLWDNIRVILGEYKSYVFWYTILTGIISFIVCYRWGPVENERTKNLIRWSMQGFGLICVFLSSHFQEATVGQIVIMVVLYNTPKRWLMAPKYYLKKRFPPKLKLLSNDEYYQQGVKETTKALEDLRGYCSSPDCPQWKMALKLSNVKRFASFVEGESHLNDDEVLEYETSIHGEFTDDSEEGNTLTDDEEY